MENLPEIYSRLIKEKAIELGFSACGIAAVRSLEEERNRLHSWLLDGMNGSMNYMANHFEKRLDPGKLEEGAKSVISVLINYFPALKQTDLAAPKISKYAYGKDYHLVVKEKLNNLLTFIQSAILPCNGRAFTDSAPVLERPWAKAAGLGWIGKNSLLVSKEHGSYVFIGELIIDLELSYDTPFGGDFCGNCSRCIDACPTGAIVAPRVIDARKCISYHTIENKEEVPESIKAQLHNQLFGCDICQDVCPWNKKIMPNQSNDFKPIKGLLEMSWKDWMKLEPNTYTKIFSHSAFERAGYKRIKRNISFLKE
ncbi:MAG: tRNA epoxyqueuosine(34) reductase QueG [Bacteroidia bacterium]|nr:tRNA epoxyqueuosine(34) reductase QueG [Bacteroidia bacterium]